VTIPQYMRLLAERLPKLLNARKAEIVEQVGALISDNMINASNRSWLLLQSGRASRYVPRTDNDPRLYVNSGNLLKAASIPNAEGNVAEVRYKNGEFIVEMGVDLSVIPYARIHEYGGRAGRGGSVLLKARPYLGPALEEYSQDNSPLRDLIDEILDDLERIASR
jgi:phage gpG-like protein